MVVARRLGFWVWNPQQHRLRLLWRLIGFVVLLFVCTTALDLVWRWLRLDRWNPDWVPFYAGNGVRALALVAATWLATLWLDRRPWADLGFQWGRQWWADLGFGLALGALLMVIIFAVEWAMGWVTVVDTFRTADPNRWFWRGLLAPFLIFLYVGVYEELLSRGYLLRNLAEGFNVRWIGPSMAILLGWAGSSLLFGLAHAGNPNSSWVSTLYLALGGLFLGLGYVLTGELAISIGLHITWNFFQGVVLGFPVSGVDFSQTTVLSIRQGGPSLWTGGTFGPEAGLLGAFASLFGCLLVLLWVRWRYGRVWPEAAVARYRPRSRHNMTG